MSAVEPPSSRVPVVPIERAVVERVRSGDASAFRELFRSHAARVRRFLRNLVDSDAAADEATQECFVRAHAALTGGAEVQSLVPWLLGVARNVAREQQRSRKNLVALEADEAEQHVSPAPDPEALLLGREADALLSRALERLSEDRRAALVLRVDQGLAYEDIAAILGWNVARVKNEIHRARMQLRAAIAARLDRSEDER
ncbi:MAG: sigma-70 family RNA polymerase sigma factor [Polyangiales bacterium]